SGYLVDNVLHHTTVTLDYFSALHRRLPRSLHFPYTTLFRSRRFPGNRKRPSFYKGKKRRASPSDYDDRPGYGEYYGSRRPGKQRSEEHTSELQSRFDLVCRLLLEKKKKLIKLRTTNATTRSP